MSKDKWIWMPHAGHFICADKCRFRLNTYVNGYIISTIGELWNEQEVRKIHAKNFCPVWFKKNKNLKGEDFDFAYMKQFGFEEIGLDRKYETMVFKAKKSKNKCCPYEIITRKNIESNSYNEPEDAYKGHFEICERYDKKQ